MALTTVRPQGMGFDTGRRNLVINGAMQVAQRGTSFTNPANVAYTLDRWLLTKVTAGAVDISQSTEAPVGFYNSLKVDVTTADTSIAADDLYMVYQLVEDVNARHLEIGTSDAVNVSVSFWVRSSKTGTYCLNIKNYGSTRAFVKEYTINSADTWEKKELSIPMDTAGSGWYASGRAFALGFVVMAGTNYHISNETWTTVTSNFAPATSNQVNGLDSTANDFYITGVQLEVGTNASDFEHRSYGEELAACQRYYLISGASAGLSQNTTNVDFSIPFPQEMRADPTLGQQGVATITNVATADFAQSSTSISSVNIDQRGAHVRLLNFSGLTTAATYLWRNFNSNLLTFDSEL